MEPIAAPAPTVATATALVDVLDTHHRMHSRYRLAVGSACKIGRSIGCDIVLDDPYAAAEHAVVTLLEDGRVCIEDLGGRNVTRIDGERMSAATPTTVGDCELIIGHTRLRIRTTQAAPLPERLFRRDLLQRYQTLLALWGLTLSAGFAAFHQWIAAPEPLGAKILTASIGTIAAIGVWVGIWGLITRVGHGAWTLRTHIAIAANTVALCAWSDWLLGVAAFSLQWRWLDALAAFIAAAAILCALYLHLRKATHLTIRRAAFAAVAMPIALGAVGLWVADQNNANSVNQVSLGIAVYPPQLRIADSLELNDYLVQAAELKKEANRKRRASLAERPLAE